MSRPASNPSTPKFLRKGEVLQKLSGCSNGLFSRDSRPSLTRFFTPKSSVSSHKVTQSWCTGLDSAALKQQLALWEQRNKAWMHKKLELEQQLKEAEAQEAQASEVRDPGAFQLFRQVMSMYEHLSQEFFKEKAKNAKASRELLQLKQALQAMNKENRVHDTTRLPEEGHWERKYKSLAKKFNHLLGKYRALQLQQEMMVSHSGPELSSILGDSEFQSEFEDF